MRDFPSCLMTRWCQMNNLQISLLVALILCGVISAWLSIKLQGTVGHYSVAAEKALGLDRSGAMPTQFVKYIYNAFRSNEIALLPTNLRASIRAYALLKIFVLVLFLAFVRSVF